METLFYVRCLADALIIACGYQVTHIIPVLDGRVVTSQCRRIGVGGTHCDGYMQRLIQLRHSGHFAQMSYPRAEVGRPSPPSPAPRIRKIAVLALNKKIGYGFP